jgi:hypothetical protein
MVTTITMKPAVNTANMFYIVTIMSTALLDTGSGISGATVVHLANSYDWQNKINTCDFILAYNTIIYK